jgi:poly-gamma-glutamate capsule biosynthesis protein CapA/YwtB (metallophosphatase superfamily)
MNGEINSQKNKRNIFIVLVILFIILISIGFYIPSNSSFSQHSIFKNNDSHLKVLVVGDIMLDRNVRNLINKNSFDSFFSGVKDLIKNADIAVGNLEGAFTTNPSITADLKNKALQFTFDPSLAPALSDLGFDILGLANNHSYNYGKQGLESTRRYIGRQALGVYAQLLQNVF